MMDETSVVGPMKNPAHPGRVLQGLYLEPLGMNVSDAAKLLGVSRQVLSQLIKGKHSITPELALKIAESFNSAPELWLGMQRNFDLRQAEKTGALLV